MGAVKHTTPSVPRWVLNEQRFPLCSLIKTWGVKLVSKLLCFYCVWIFRSSFVVHHVSLSAGLAAGTSLLSLFSDYGLGWTVINYKSKMRLCLLYKRFAAVFTFLHCINITCSLSECLCYLKYSKKGCQMHKYSVYGLY